MPALENGTPDPDESLGSSVFCRPDTVRSSDNNGSGGGRGSGGTATGSEDPLQR